jgi:hypothetical protein
MSVPRQRPINQSQICMSHERSGKRKLLTGSKTSEKRIQKPDVEDEPAVIHEVLRAWE